jgi:glyoxylase-like metal-dependent hydrolase (beta-lactamase superfamily II)
MRWSTSLAAGVLLAAAAAARAQGPADTMFTVTEARPGVYFVTGRPGEVVGGNAAFVVTDRDVVVVDGLMTPTAARALVGEIRRVTDKPIRYLVDTHFHYDHTNGNGVFGAGVEIVAHSWTRARLAATGAQAITQLRGAVPAQLAALRARRDTTTDPAARALLDRQGRNLERAGSEYQSLAVTLPTVAVDSSLVLYRGGGQEIRILYLGRGHTGGDLFVHLPREGVLIAGDMLTNTAGPPYMADGYAGEWGATLRRVAQLDFAVTLPGHGAPVEGKQRFLATADFLDAVWRQVGELARRGVARDSVARAVDVSPFVAAFPALRAGLSPVAAQRAYDVATGKAQ